MKTVVCINDKNLPQGATLTEGKEYNVVDEYLNALDQRVYILEGITNDGTTKWGMRWTGYNAQRFRDLEGVYNEEKEVNFALN